LVVSGVEAVTDELTAARQHRVASAPAATRNRLDPGASNGRWDVTSRDVRAQIEATKAAQAERMALMCAPWLWPLVWVRG
jgi:hypothetical protein